MQVQGQKALLDKDIDLEGDLLAAVIGEAAVSGIR
jgi:hypothetical protein